MCRGARKIQSPSAATSSDFHETSQKEAHLIEPVPPRHTPSPTTYRRREPEESVQYWVLRDHFKTWPSSWAARPPQDLTKLVDHTTFKMVEHVDYQSNERRIRQTTGVGLGTPLAGPTTSCIASRAPPGSAAPAQPHPALSPRSSSAGLPTTWPCLRWACFVPTSKRVIAETHTMGASAIEDRKIGCGVRSLPPCANQSSAQGSRITCRSPAVPRRSPPKLQDRPARAWGSKKPANALPMPFTRPRRKYESEKRENEVGRGAGVATAHEATASETDASTVACPSVHSTVSEFPEGSA